MWGLPRLSVSKDTKVFAVAYEISHARADLIEIEMKLVFFLAIAPLFFNFYFSNLV